MDVTSQFKDKRILITGGLGSIGSEICSQLSRCDVKMITIFDNRETELFYRKKYAEDERINIHFGDIRDEDVLEDVMKEVDIVFHAAAMKHVYICEEHPIEAIKTNVLGTLNVVNSAIKNNIEKFILISTDKAVNPTNVMGATKLLAEKIITSQIRKRSHVTRFGIVRFGNVLSSRGSVLEIWDRQINDGKPITLTNPNMTRFFMSIPDSVELIFNATELGRNGETFIFKMPAVKIVDLAKAYLKIHNLPEDNIRIIGENPGEKLNEDLLNNEEKRLLLENSKMFVRMPIYSSEEDLGQLIEKGFSTTHMESFCSDNKGLLLTVDEVKLILDRT